MDWTVSSRGPRVRAAVDLPVRPTFEARVRHQRAVTERTRGRYAPPAVHRGHHDRPGLLEVDAEAAEAEVQVAPRDRGDVRPDARGDVVLEDRAGGAVVRTRVVVVRDVEELLGRGEDALVREVVDQGLAGDGGPVDCKIFLSERTTIKTPKRGSVLIIGLSPC